MAKERDGILLVSDNVARKVADKLGVKTANIPAFLLSCKKRKLLTNEEIREIIDDLFRENHYRFRKEQKKELLG